MGKQEEPGTGIVQNVAGLSLEVKIDVLNVMLEEMVNRLAGKDDKPVSR